MLATVTSLGGLAACIDLPDALDPEHAEASGIHLSRVLWVRPHDPRTAIRAAEQVASTRGFRLITLDLDAPCAKNWTASTGVWLRLARLAAQSEMAIVVAGPAGATRACAALRLEVQRRRVEFSGEGPSSLFDGIDATVHLQKSKIGPLSAVPAVLSVPAA